MTEKIKVAIRIRPINEREREYTCSEFFSIVNGEPKIIIKETTLTYDYVFSDTSQIQIYKTAVFPLLDNVFSGYNATVLAYGQTGS